VLKAVERAGTPFMVFSSTCATYGEPTEMPIRETTPQSPINPYGWSKLLSEYMLRDYAAKAPHFGYAALRYFNVAGSAEDGSVGEDHDPETHLIPVILQAALGQREKLTVFGEDYPTADGTCIRDYIHVEDLVGAHVRVMEALAPGDARIYNLGIGKGYSVKEIIDAARKAHAHEFVDRLPEAYNNMVGERGVKLSGGQRQRIAIARAILKEAPILVLDEATSALDSESERLIQKALGELMRDRTAIVIAHRLSTVQKMDRILVLENGRVIEDGSHETLVAQKGTYADLWAHQSGGFI